MFLKKSSWSTELDTLFGGTRHMNFKNIVYSGFISFVYEDKEKIHKSVQYEVPMTDCIARIANQRKIPEWLPFKNYKSELLNI